MNLNEYQQRAMTTCTPSSNNISYMLLNLMGEVGEMASKIAKSIRKDEAYVGKVQQDGTSDCDLHFCCDQDTYKERKQHMMLEAGDILWQLSGLCKVMGWSLEDVAQANLDKLASRKERNKIVGEGDDR